MSEGYRQKLKVTKPRVGKGRGKGTAEASSSQPGGPSRSRAPQRPPTPSPPPSPPPRYAGPNRTIMHPRYVDFGDLDTRNVVFTELFSSQGWLRFMSKNKIFYPELVQEFYGNLRKNDEDVLVSTVRGVLIEIDTELLAQALHIPDFGLAHDDLFDANIANQAITCRNPERIDRNRRSQMNINTSPPLQRIFHHMMTTILYPKGGGRHLVTKVHKWFFFGLFDSVQLDLPGLMVKVIDEIRTSPTRSLPYATHLSTVFRQMGLVSPAEPQREVKHFNIYNLSNLRRYMHFGLDANNDFIRVDKHGNPLESEEDSDESESEFEDSAEEEDQQMDVDPEPPAAEQERTMDELYHRIEDLEINVNGRFDSLDQRLDEMHQTHSHHYDAHSQMLQELLGYLRPRSDEPPPQ